MAVAIATNQDIQPSKMRKELNMAFFRKGKKKKGNGIPEESKTPSAEIAKQRAEDIQSNYDSDSTNDDFDRGMEELPEDYTSANYSASSSEPEDLDPLLSGNLDDSMLSFDEDVEKDIEAESEDSSPEEEVNEDEHDFFADVELPEETSGELSETDNSFSGLYDVDGDELEEDESKKSDPSAENISVEDDLAQTISEEDVLTQSLSETIEEQLIEEEEEPSPDGMASKSQIYMAMQVFDSETGDFDMKGVDNQLVFDTDDEDSFGFSCHKDEEIEPEKVDVSSYVFDTSEEDQQSFINKELGGFK